jgi:hypothetical protein
MKSVKEERDQALAVRLSRAAQGVERQGIICVRAKRILQVLLNLVYRYLYIILTRC